MREKNIPHSENSKPTPLGPLPEDWEVVRLGEVVDYKLGKTPSRNKIEYWENGVYSWVSIADMRNSRFIHHTKEKINVKALNECFSGKITPKGTLLLSFKLTIGRTAFLGIDATHNEAIISIYPKDNVDKYFLYYYFPTIDYSNYMDRAIKGNTLNKSKLNNILIPLPPLPEQKKIAYVLSVIQEAEEQTQKYIDALKELKKSTMKHLFTYGAVAFEEIDKVELKETEIGWVPKHWGVVRVVDLFEITKKPKKTIKDNELIPFISMENISDSKETPTYTLKEFSKISSGIFVLKDDLIISKITPCFENGKQAILTNLPSDFGIATTEVIPLHPKDDRKVITKHLYNFLKIPEVREKLANKMEGTTGRKRLPKHALNHFLIPLPPPPEQQHIAEILSNIDKNIEVAENKKKAINKIFQSMLKNLMTAKIRVNNLEVKYDA